MIIFALFFYLVLIKNHSMKKILTIIGILCLGFGSMFAQTVQVSGTVTDAETGETLPGVTVLIKGTFAGTTTTVDGRYQLEVPANATLQFSFVGLTTQEVIVGDRRIIDVAMESGANVLDEVVVTALGISRERKSLGYAVQSVEGDELSRIRTGNVINSLSGRVAGVQITSSSGQLGGGARINIRGNTSLTGNNQPLFVVDGVPISNADYSTGSGTGSGYNQGTLASDVSPDDVESMTVLKGASATAMYGSRGANGVVVITTKKGAMTAAKTLGVSVNSSITFDQVGIMPKFQKLYGGGEGLLAQATINGQTFNIPAYDVDESWGPKYDPSLLVLPWNAFDEWDTKNYLKPKPWVYPANDYTTYFKTGVGINNNIQVMGSDENYSFRLSYSNLSQTGMLENSKLNRNNVSFSGTSRMNRFLDGFLSVNYVNTKAKGRPMTGYGDHNTTRTMFQWSQTQLDYKELKEYKNPDGTHRTWNRRSWDDSTGLYADNPYWTLYENYESDSRDRLFGNGGLNINLAPGLKLTGRGGIDAWMYNIEERVAIGSVGLSQYYLVNRVNVEANGDLFLTYNNRFAGNQLGLSAMMGASIFNRNYYHSGGVTVNGLIVPGVYNLGNSVAKATSYDSKLRKRINSVYGNVTLDWNTLVYLDITARNDWSSALPAENNSYFYPSFNLSFILSQLQALQSVTWLNFAKLRAGYAIVGNDTDAYRLQNYFNFENPFGSDTRFSISTSLQNPNLRPEKTTSWEIGAEAYFLNNRLGIDIAYFEKSTIDQIILASVSSVTGYSTRVINTGEISNKGLEVTLNFAPFRSRTGFNWDMQLNMATLNSKVVSISPDITWISLGSNGFSVYTGAYAGETYPVIYGKDNIYGPKGEKMVGTNGLYLRTPTDMPLAKVTPNFTAGFSNTFSWKGIDMSVLFDMQTGGNIYYLTKIFGIYSGILEESAKKTNVPGKTGDIREDGLILDGVVGRSVANEDGTYRGEYLNADGTAASGPVTNERVIAADTWGSHHYSGPNTMGIHKTDYIKLREIRVGYTLPQKFTGPVKDLRLSVFGRNLATFMTDQNHFDPEYLQMAGHNAQGLEGGYVPTTRTIGFSIGFSF